MSPHDILRHYYGYDTFREGQLAIIDAILAKQDVMSIMPTGALESQFVIRFPHSSCPI